MSRGLGDVYKRQVLGYLDDVILFPALVSLTVKFIPEDVLKKTGEMLRESGAAGTPGNGII